MNGVEVNCNLHVPEELRLEKIDLCSIYCNLIDNAIEAGMKEPDPERKRIVIRSGYQGGILTIETENTLDKISRKILGGKRKTTKTNAQDHGYGMELIRRIVNKYNGSMEMKEQEGQLKVQVVLQV